MQAEDLISTIRLNGPRPTDLVVLDTSPAWRSATSGCWPRTPDLTPLRRSGGLSRGRARR